MKEKLLFLNIFAFTVIALLLQGCVAAVVATGAAATAVVGSSVIADNRSAATILTDRKMTSAAQAKLNGDAVLSGKTHISVATFNKIMLLVGQAPTTELRDRAVRLVSTIPNTKVLHDEIELDYATPASVQVNDAWLTTKIKSTLFAEHGPWSTQMKIVTENGAVYLMGLVTRDQGDLAAKKISRIRGVKKVVKLFEYIR